MKLTLALLGQVALYGLAIADEQSWAKFKSRKKYVNQNSEEKSKQQFTKHRRFIEEHNSAPNSFEVELNDFADKDPNEVAFSKGLSRPETIPEVNVTPVKIGGTIPKRFDWTEQGAVTEVQNQGSVCGSCYTYSATGALEGQMFIRYKKLPKFSEQSFIDCSDNNGNDGCGGGFPQNVFKYLMKNSGINYQSDYHYLEKKSICRAESHKKANITVVAYNELLRGDETNLKNALYKYGPISISIDANHTSFQFYKKGVYYEPDCKNGFYDLDHAMLLVGYDTTPDGVDYWIIKNSWGPNWGIKGYFWLARNINNHCGVATDGVYPEIL